MFKFELLVLSVLLAVLKSAAIFFICGLLPQLGPDLIATIYLVLLLSNSRSIPVMPDL